MVWWFFKQCKIHAKIKTHPLQGGRCSSKAVSRVLYRMLPCGFYHLSGPAIAGQARSNLPILTASRCRLVRERAAPLSGPIWSFNSWGLPRSRSPGKAVSSYLTFSPLPLRAVYSLWHLLSPAAWRLPVRKQDALCCPDFPPRTEKARSDRTFCRAKIRFLRLINLRAIFEVLGNSIYINNPAFVTERVTHISKHLGNLHGH